MYVYIYIYMSLSLYIYIYICVYIYIYIYIFTSISPRHVRSRTMLPQHSYPTIYSHSIVIPQHSNSNNS